MMDVIIQKDLTEDIVVKLVKKRHINIILKDIDIILHIHYFVIFIPEKDILKDIQDILKDIQDIQKDIQGIQKDLQKEDYLVYFYFNLFFV
jgi:hypothetical protein